MKLIIKNGTIINPAKKENFKGYILIEDGKIKKIDKKEIKDKEAEIIDAEGLIVAPGFIDAHVHFRDPGFEHKEDIISGLKAAAAGGFTAVITMPNTNPVVDNLATIRYMLEKARNSGNGVKLYPMCAASKNQEGKALSPMGELRENGAVAVTDDGKPIEDTSLLKRVMEYASTFDMTYVSHAEDTYLSKGTQMNDGYFSTVYGMNGNPIVGEASQVARDCMMAFYCNLPVHIAHVSGKMTVDIIEFYKSKGAKITAETAPHYLTLTDEAVGSFDTNTKINPALRTEEDRVALIEALHKGVIDIVATDHAPHHEREKNVEFNNAPSGIVGLETALPLMLKLYHEKHLSLEKIVELFTGAYKIFNLEGGIIEEGKPADITIFDPNYQWTIDKNMFQSKSCNTPFHGFHVKGAAFTTIVDGKVVFSKKF